MNPTIKQLLGEDTTPDGKLLPEVVMYLDPKQVNNAEGCRCGRCMFFNADKSECFLTSPAACDADHGVCGLYMGSKSIFTKDGTAQQLISKKAAGYITDAPTHCENCEYFIKEGEGGCKNVGGHIYAKGCCNGWETKEGKE